MDIVYMTSSFIDEGVLADCIADFESSTNAESNSFEIETALSNHKVPLGGYVYIDGTEFGGKVDAINIDTARSVVKYKGRTWLGMLSSKIVQPDNGSAYLTVSGDANSIIGQLLTRCELDDVLAASDVLSGITVESYQIPRYINLFEALRGMLQAYSGKLNVRCSGSSIVIGASPIAEYTDAEELTDDAFDFEIETNKGAANHVVALGSGTLTSRMVVHRYVQSDGTIGGTQYYIGADEIMIVLDEPNAESTADLTAKADEALSKAAIDASLKVTANNINADVGDLFAAYDKVSGITVQQYVVDKITVIEGEKIKTTYKMGGAI